MPATDLFRIAIDWADCPLVESNPLKLSGVPVVKGTRVPADAVLDNSTDRSPAEEIAENFAIAAATVSSLLAFADLQKNSWR